MEDFAWIIFVFVFWVVSSLGEMRKAGGKRRHKERERTEDLPRRPDPVATRRRLDEDLDEASKQAAEALKRWEQRQTELARREAPAPSPVPPSPERSRTSQVRTRRRTRDRARDQSRGPGARPTRAEEAAESRNEAYEAIAEMLGARSRPKAPDEVAEPVRRPESSVESVAATAAPAEPAQPALSAPARVAPRRGATAGPEALARLDRYPPLQRAIVLSEIFGPPHSLR